MSDLYLKTDGNTDIPALKPMLLPIIVSSSLFSTPVYPFITRETITESASDKIVKYCF